jgi:hypothetical protein
MPTLAIDMTKYYRLLYDDKDKYAVAESRELPLTEDILPQKRINQGQWKPIAYKAGKGILTDMLGENLGLVVISQKFKDLIDEQGILPVNMQLIKNPVKDAKGKLHDYYIVHIAKPMDTLHSTESVFMEDSLIKPVLDSEKIKPYKLLSFSQDSSMPSLVVSADIRKMIIEKGLTGMEINPIPVV